MIDEHDGLFIIFLINNVCDSDDDFRVLEDFLKNWSEFLYSFIINNSNNNNAAVIKIFICRKR